MQAARSTLRDRLAGGARTRGVWSSLGYPPAVALLARAGFDWICLDAQHGLHDAANLGQTLGQLAPMDADVLVRVAWNDPALIGRALDLGAAGVIVPMVQDAAEAEAAAAACRYAPAGRRSWGPLGRLTGAPVTPAGQANRDVLCAVMVETPQAVANAERIAEVDGVDAIFVGPYDLALASGTTVEKLLADTAPTGPLPRVVAACQRAGRTPGAYAGSVPAARVFEAMGYRMTAVADDAALLAEAAARAAGTVPGDH